MHSFCTWAKNVIINLILKTCAHLWRNCAGLGLGSGNMFSVLVEDFVPGVRPDGKFLEDLPSPRPMGPGPLITPIARECPARPAAIGLFRSHAIACFAVFTEHSRTPVPWAGPPSLSDGSQRPSEPSARPR